jgi:hypothetical protein
MWVEIYLLRLIWTYESRLSRGKTFSSVEGYTNFSYSKQLMLFFSKM